jgi:glyoxylase-like metal-dependent hydrolase (beta-lactamase superfamily II)
MREDSQFGRTEEDVLRHLGQRHGIHVLRISTPLPTFKVNVYFVEKPVPTLIDAPPDRPESLEEMEAALNALGFSTRDIRVIIVTHPHFDHFGSAQTIMEGCGGEVWAGRETGEWMAGFDQECLDEEEFTVDILKRARVPSALVSASKQHFQHLKQYARVVPKSRVLEEGETVQLASTHANVCRVPGHTPWCTMFYAEKEGIAFTGDFLLADISPNPLMQRPSKVPRGYNSLRTYVASLTRVNAMGLRVALPGHGPIIVEPSERIEILFEHIEARRNTVIAAFRHGDKTLFELVKEVFPDLPPAQIFLAVSEVFAHVEALCTEGVLKMVDSLPDRYAIA